MVTPKWFSEEFLPKRHVLDVFFRALGLLRNRLKHSSIDASAKLSQLNDWFSEERRGTF